MAINSFPFPQAYININVPAEWLKRFMHFLTFLCTFLGVGLFSSLADMKRTYPESCYMWLKVIHCLCFITRMWYVFCRASGKTRCSQQWRWTISTPTCQFFKFKPYLGDLCAFSVQGLEAYLLLFGHSRLILWWPHLLPVCLSVHHHWGDILCAHNVPF